MDKMKLNLFFQGVGKRCEGEGEKERRERNEERGKERQERGRGKTGETKGKRKFDENLADIWRGNESPFIIAKLMVQYASYTLSYGSKSLKLCREVRFRM